MERHSTVLNFFDVLTVAIFPFNNIFCFGSKFISAEYDSIDIAENKIANIVVVLFI